MVRAPFEKPSPGDRNLYASEYAAFIDTANIVRKRFGGADNSASGSEAYHAALTLHVKNIGPALAEPFTLVGFGDADVLGDPNDVGAPSLPIPVVEAKAYDDGDAWGILQVPFAEVDQVQLNGCAISGACWAKVNITDASHTTAGPVGAASVVLTSDKPGAEILWKPTGTGIKLCFVQFASGAKQVLTGTITGSIATFGDTNIVITRTDGGGTLTDVRWNNPGHAVAGSTLAIGTFVWVGMDNDGSSSFWRFMTWPCPTPP